MHYFRGAEQQSIDVAKSPRFDISSFGKRLRCMNPQTWFGRLLGPLDSMMMIVANFWCCQLETLQPDYSAFPPIT